MTNTQLKTLLQRFMNGTTTVDEEVALARFFRNAADSDRPHDMAEDDWRAYREMFAMFDADVVADEPTIDTAPAVAPSTATRWQRYRSLAGWMTAAAAAVALLVVVVPYRRQSSDGSSAIATQQPMASVSTMPDADSIASQLERPVAKDSLDRCMRKDGARTHRPYWQPRPPKTYVAEKAEPKADMMPPNVDPRSIEEAVSQTEILLQAISVHQAAELNRLQSEAMEVFADVDADVDADYTDGE